ncbi:MAG: hypothetical protein V2A73_00600 [Pseudomonadota bacterium]
MKHVKGKYEKEELHIGLSSELPNSDQSEAYSVEDLIARSSLTYVKHVKQTFQIEMVTTAATEDLPLVWSPERIRCYRLVSAMPEPALPEVEEELQETFQHYIALAAAAQAPKLLPAKREVKASVTERVRT